MPILAFLLLLPLAGLSVAAEEPAVTDEPTKNEEEDESVEVHEEWVTVKAQPDGGASGPLGASSTVLDPRQVDGTLTSLTELAVAAPGVSENGQGGLFQGISVRGVARQRVTHKVGAARITSERRAGPSASFVDASLLGSAEILRGPATTFHGSGALGGVVQLYPRRFKATTVETGFDTSGDERFLTAGAGGKIWSVGLAFREAGDAEAADGTELNSAFTQVSGVARLDWTTDRMQITLSALPSYAKDVGKSSTDYPSRRTTYPRERHQLVEARLQHDAGWQLEAFVHGQDLETEVIEAAQESYVASDTMDLGVRWESDRSPFKKIDLRWGGQLFARRDVDAEENLIDLDLSDGDDSAFSRTLRNGEELEGGLFGVIAHSWERITLEGGARVTRHEQDNEGIAERGQTKWSGFAAVRGDWAEHWKWRGAVSSGLRFPSLSERFFSGTTGRGTVIGNPDLDPERSLNVESSLSWSRQRLSGQVTLFHNEIDDYIEREEIATDLLTFFNRTSGTIQGLELQGLFAISRTWLVGLGGHRIRGRGDEGTPLSDVPAHEIYAEAVHRGKRWSHRMRWAHREANNDFNPSEKFTPTADLVDFTVGFEIAEGLRLSLSGSNLLDEEYFNSADDKVPLAPGRAASLHLVWRRN